jgi:hypothetical protein
MKHFILIISLGAITIFLGSCKKDISKVDNINSNSIVGIWELRQAQNGMIPTIEYSPGNGDILKFSDSTYENYTNGNLIKSGHYILIRDTSVEAEVGLVIPTGRFTNRIIFNSDFASRKTFIEVSNNKLTLLSGFFPLDGGSNQLYEKIKNNR